MDWNERLWHAKSGGQEDGNDFSDVGRDQVADELLGVVVDGTSLLDSELDRGEVVISENLEIKLVSKHVEGREEKLAISAASLATSVPDPMATPMSDFLRAGASLTPSPVMATTSPAA